MNFPGKPRRERQGTSAGGGIRPGLLAGGLGLVWFVQGQPGAMPAVAPGWALALVFAGRLAADLVGALLVVSVARLGLAAARLAWLRWQTQRQLDK